MNNGLSQDGIHFPTVQALGISGNYVIAGTRRTGIFRSSDEGLSWIAADSGLGTSNSDVKQILKKDHLLFAAVDGGGMYRSQDNGASWIPVNSGITDSSILALALVDSILVAGTWDGPMFRSTNNGDNWTNCPRYIPYDITLTSIGSNLFAGTWYGGVYRSTDYGSTWVVRDSNLTETNIESFAVSGGWLFACTLANGYVVVSRNMGATWNDITDSLRLASIRTLFVHDSTIFAGGNGIYLRRLAGIVTSTPTVSTETLTEFFLSQNYPNPCNPSTTIRYSVPTKSHVTLSVFNALGQRAATIVNGVVDPGNHEVSFDGTGLASGVYFYTLRAGKHLGTKRLILIR
jgi:hypothetical protein